MRRGKICEGVIIPVRSWLRYGYSSYEGNVIVGNLFPWGIPELEVKLVGGGIPARIGGPLGVFCKGGTVPARKIIHKGDPWSWGNHSRKATAIIPEKDCRGLVTKVLADFLCRAES